MKEAFKKLVQLKQRCSFYNFNELFYFTLNFVQKKKNKQKDTKKSCNRTNRCLHAYLPKEYVSNSEQFKKLDHQKLQQHFVKLLKNI